MTLLSAGDPEEAQATCWRPISWKWPCFASPPNLQLLGLEEAACAPDRVRGNVVLAKLDSAADTAWFFRLLPHLEDAGIPVVVIASEATGMDPARGNEDMIIIPRTTEPAVIGPMLHALAVRQPVIEALRADLQIARRFHGGLQNEMEKIHDELQLAASVQREFLPKQLPVVSNIDVQVLFRPCSYVSGDIYDVQRLDEHHLGFFVADAVGHGVPAALMTMVLCRCLGTLALEHERGSIVPAGEVLRALNTDLIRRHGDVSRFATAVYGIVDTRTRRVTLAGAGHPYPLRISPRGIERIETTGGILGVFPEDEFSEVSFELELDEMLVIYSDGFETAFPPQDADHFGRKMPNTNYVERFECLAQVWREGGLGSAVKDLWSHIDRQAGSLHQVDDLTAMLIVPRIENSLDRLFSGQLEAPQRQPTVIAPARL